MKKRKFKLIFGGSTGTILNAEKFSSIKEKLPTDVEIIRRKLIWEQTGLKEPYILQLDKEKYERFVKEFKQKIPFYGVLHSIHIEGTNEEIVKIQIK